MLKKLKKRLIMEVKAQTKHIRMSPRKLNLVAKSIKDLPLEKALEKLSFLRKRAAEPLLKTLNSAIANATNNFGLKKDNLRIKSIQILKGPTLKRWRAVSRGRAHPYEKKTSHIKVILTKKNGTKD